MAVKKATDATEAVETTTAEEVDTNKEKTVKTANTSVERMVYIGPSLPKAQLKCNTVMIGTPEEIKKMYSGVFDKFPLVEKMLVPVSELADKKQKIKAPDNIYHKYYTDIVSMVAAAEKEE